MLEGHSDLISAQKTGLSHLNVKTVDNPVACLGATSIVSVSDVKPENISAALREMRHMPSVMSLINAISLTPQARVLVERALASVAL